MTTMIRARHGLLCRSQNVPFDRCARVAYAPKMALPLYHRLADTLAFSSSRLAGPVVSYWATTRGDTRLRAPLVGVLAIAPVLWWGYLEVLETGVGRKKSRASSSGWKVEWPGPTRRMGANSLSAAPALGMCRAAHHWGTKEAEAPTL
jgi:hypothetical protein